MRAARVELADDTDAALRAELLLQLERGVEAGATGADDDRVEVVDPARRDDGAGGDDQGHENGPVGGAVFGSKKTMTAMPSTSQIALIARRMPTSRLRAVRFVT